MNLRQSAGKYLYNVRIVDSTLQRVDNTTSKGSIRAVRLYCQECSDLYVTHANHGLLANILADGVGVAVAIQEGLDLL